MYDRHAHEAGIHCAWWTAWRCWRSAALWRGAWFFVLWMLLMQSMKPADLAVGGLACAAMLVSRSQSLPARNSMALR